MKWREIEITDDDFDPVVILHIDNEDGSCRDIGFLKNAGFPCIKATPAPGSENPAVYLVSYSWRSL